MRDHLLAGWRVMWKGVAIFLLVTCLVVVVLAVLWGVVFLVSWLSGVNLHIIGIIFFSMVIVGLFAMVMIPTFKHELRSIRRKKDSR